MKDWRFQLAHTYNDVGGVDAAQALATSLVLPEHITSARASWAPTARTNVDLWWRYTGARSSPGNPLLVRNAYTSIDMRLGWKPRKDLELSLMGQNLNDGACQSIAGLPLAAEVTGTVLTCMPRAVNLQARLDF
jgi:iron complex outermembrane receptor protein